MASSIQPNFAAIRTRHCSRVTVRYQGTAAAVATGISLGVNGVKRVTSPTTSHQTVNYQLARVRIYDSYTRRLRMSVDVGAKAPDFTLHNQNREDVTLSEELKKGPVVLAFFPAAFSGTCQQEMCTFRDSAADLNTVNAQVLGVSTDTFFALKAWGDQQKLNFPLLSDFNREVLPKYGVLNPDMIGMKNIAKRAVFVIDRSGTVRYREVLEDARNEPNYDNIKKALASL
jgi:peroxiredoxin